MSTLAVGTTLIEPQTEKALVDITLAILIRAAMSRIICEECEKGLVKFQNLEPTGPTPECDELCWYFCDHDDSGYILHGCEDMCLVELGPDSFDNRRYFYCEAVNMLNENPQVIARAIRKVSLSFTIVLESTMDSLKTRAMEESVYLTTLGSFHFYDKSVCQVVLSLLAPVSFLPNAMHSPAFLFHSQGQ
jgi:hypothetical protein